MREAKFKHYKPKRWQPEFDLIIIESVSGKSNEEIGRIYGYTKEHISNILSTEEAGRVKDKIRGEIEKGVEKDLGRRFSNIGEKAVKHLEKFIEDETGRAERSPFEFIDRAMKIGAAVGVIAGSGSGDKKGNTMLVNGNVLMVSNEKMDEVRKAMIESAELDKIGPG